MAEKTSNLEHGKLQRNVRGIIIMLALQLLLGMAVNLLGTPDETVGGTKVTTSIFLMLHVLIGIGLIIRAAMAVKASRQFELSIRHHALYGAIIIGMTFIFGGLTAMTSNNWWSYLMATGFLGSLLLYGKILLTIAHASRI